jgi:hypothetical protein
MHARLDRGAVKLLTRTGLDWTRKYPAIVAAVAALGAQQAYIDGELCGVFPDGITSFGMIQAASGAGNAAGLVFFIFDLLHLDGDDISARPLIERKARLAGLLADAGSPCLAGNGEDKFGHLPAAVMLRLENVGVSCRGPACFFDGGEDAGFRSAATISGAGRCQCQTGRAGAERQAPGRAARRRHSAAYTAARASKAP